MTTTARSLERVREIVDTYVELGLAHIFLRPLSPYGFAIKTKSHAAYDGGRWLNFYETGLRYILELNRLGFRLRGVLSIVLKKMTTNATPGTRPDLAAIIGGTRTRSTTQRPSATVSRL